MRNEIYAFYTAFWRKYEPIGGRIGAAAPTVPPPWIRHWSVCCTMRCCYTWRRTYTSRESSGYRTGPAKWCCASRRSTGRRTFMRRSTELVLLCATSGTLSRSVDPAANLTSVLSDFWWLLLVRLFSFSASRHHPVVPLRYRLSTYGRRAFTELRATRFYWIVSVIQHRVPTVFS